MECRASTLQRGRRVVWPCLAKALEYTTLAQTDWESSSSFVRAFASEDSPHFHISHLHCFYCVETICAPCGVVVAWTKFAKAESETNILDFLTATYPNEATRPDYVCIDKAC